MKAPLDLGDIQGNILQGYGRFGFPHVRHLLFHFDKGTEGRRAVQDLLPLVTNSEVWADDEEAADRYGPDEGLLPRPKVTLNIAFTWLGMAALDVPVETLIQFPPEFIEGMSARSGILSDVGESGPANWDPVWRQAARGDQANAVHMLVTLNGQMQADASPVPEFDVMTGFLRELGKRPGITLLKGHGRSGDDDYQQSGALMVPGQDGAPIPSALEHFGFADGIGDPVFEGQYPPDVERHRVHGRGKLMPDQTWKPLAAGEFLIGYSDESQEVPRIVQPPTFVRNGTFMVFRKLHQNVAAFETYLADHARKYAMIKSMDEAEANATLRAKMIGRWPNGVPLAVAPTYEKMQEFDAKWAEIPAIQARSGRRTKAETARLADYDREMIEFRFRDDPYGVRCPIGAHIRRGNMRDMLDPEITSTDPRDWDGSALTNRRRILRRGSPYGPYEPTTMDDQIERGVIFIALCADLNRQFEFVQQQWINFGLDARTGNDNCPVLGLHHKGSKFVIQTDPEGDAMPWIMDRLPQFVLTKGGDYFFVPGVNTLNMIAKGLVDPT